MTPRIGIDTITMRGPTVRPINLGYLHNGPKPYRRFDRGASATRFRPVSKASAFDVISAAVIVASLTMVHGNGRVRSPIPPNLSATI
jgi:hypothetical protein